MLLPFSSWESPYWRSNLLKHASAISDEYLLQLEHLEPIENSGLSSRESNWLFFCSLDSGAEEANFVVTRPCAPPFIECILGIREFADLSPMQLRAELNDVLSQGQFARVFFLDANEELRQFDAHAHYLLVIAANGWSEWVRLNVGGIKTEKWYQKRAAFRWTDTHNPARFLSTSASAIWAQIQSQKSDASSDCAFARRTLDLSDAQMNTLLYEWKHGTRAELEQVLKAAFLCQSELWEVTSGYDWTVDLGKLRTSWHRGQWAHLSGHYRNFYSLAPGILRDVLRRVAPYFEPAFDEKSTSAHLEAARWAHRFEDYLSIRVEHPSAHERLEAALLWRDWQASHPPVIP